ncbi:hypothetical protein M407DRAFT_233240 [Tulasnella calospora MUT 4182]|uniref:ERCC4 domain-containing protein n=1 Tax=Tulasnella calospora MUT 4182 TaxID=1051891 RepID=A0A0C3QL38_9AGAM|nr:hypothetical protein M407DRAFT_233240 [Tulasnella calospora MUT 4182]
MIRSSSFVSYTSEDGVEVNELLDSDEESLGFDPTPRANRTTAIRPSSTKTFSSLDDAQDSDDSDLPDLGQLNQRPIASNEGPSARCPPSGLDMNSDYRVVRASPVGREKVSSDFQRGRSGSVRPKKSRAKRTLEEVQRDKEAQVLAKQTAAEQKKLERATEKARKEAEKAQQKAEKQAHSALNKLVTSKKETLPDMTIELHPVLCNRTSALHKHIEPLVNRIMEESGTPARMRSDPPWPVAQIDLGARFLGLDNLIRWKRNVVAKYSEEDKEWQAVSEPYHRVEGTYAMYYTLREVLADIRLPSTRRSTLQGMRTLRVELGPKYQLFLIIDESGAERKSMRKDERVRLEEWLAELQIETDCFVVRPKDDDGVVTWLYNMTGDIGIKPYKLIERSHLAFCPVTRPIHNADENGTNRGQSMLGTYQQMLAQIYRVTPSMAEEISKQRGFKTLRETFETYSDSRLTERQKEELLVGTWMGRTQSGNRSTRDVGKVISSRVYNVFTTEDSLQLVGKDVE